ncbi:MAG: endopeptidase La [Saprospiraceae bacterium]|nr:endopeptidase La [Saprospiraceae bacterium]
MIYDPLISLNSGTDEDSEFMPLFSIDEEDESNILEDFPEQLPVLALKNTVLFPGIVIPITVGRNKSIKSIQKAFQDQKIIAVLSQKDSRIESPKATDLYSIGTVARIIKLLKMPDGTTTAILQGRRRFRLEEMVQEQPYMTAKVSMIEHEDSENDVEFQALISTITDTARRIIELSPNIPAEANLVLRNITNNLFLLNFIASNLSLKVSVKQEILEINPINQKARMILIQLENELQVLELKDQIENKVRGDIEKQQRDYYLNQQLKTIQEELGHNPQEEEIDRLMERSMLKSWSDKVAKHFDKELNRLRRMNPQVAEYSVQLNYLDLVLDLPWDQVTTDNFDLKKVKKILDEDHHGLEKVKERILEHLSVLKLKGDMKAPILCLVGPPGVGKTSLGRSIARALGREYVRISLGGLHDESEIRGHRKTYIGAMPGRIIQSVKKAKSANPCFVLDEIDKVGKDFRGDPSSALLEVLDPEQNSSFHDNYLEMEYDLSKVLFIATANTLSTIQPALLDRMEIIQISGYSTEEKTAIAVKHLLPKQLSEHGLKKGQLKLGTTALEKIIQEYTRESGVRSLDRQIAQICRSVAHKVATGVKYKPTLSLEDIEKILGPRKYNMERFLGDNPPGVSIGLAWTSVGGEILFIETSLSPGKGGLKLTGNLGDVMKESAVTALSYLKAHSLDYGIEPDVFNKTDIHLHVPEGAIPKDGPSAGITMLSALASAFLNKPLRQLVAMTGEITLRGKVLPVGGIKEKILAARRLGIQTVVLCEENKQDVEEVPARYRKGLRFRYVTEMGDVVRYMLQLRR